MANRILLTDAERSADLAQLQKEGPITVASNNSEAQQNAIRNQKRLVALNDPESVRVREQIQARKDAGNSDTSDKKTQSTTKEEKKEATEVAEDEVVVKKVVNPTTMYSPNNPVEAPTSMAADFYRRGQAKQANANGDLTNVSTDFSSAIDYNILPRMIEDSEHDETASIRVVGKLSKDSTKDVDLIPPYTRFFLESVQESHTERSQIVETFGEFYAFFFGERPPVYRFSGTLINAKNINWAEDFMFYYNKVLRGTKCVEMNARLVLTYSFTQIEGYMMNVQTSKQAISEKGVPVSFEILVLDRRILKLSPDVGILETNGQFSVDQAFKNSLTANGLSNEIVSDVFLKAKATQLGKANPSDSAVAKDSQANQLTKKFGIDMNSNGFGKLTTTGKKVAVA